MGIGEKALQPAGAPLHRPSDAACCVQQSGIFGIDLYLHSKAAAHVVREDANLAQRNFEHAFRKNFSYYGHALRRRDQRIALSMHIEARDCGARLHRARRQTRIDQPHPLDVRGTAQTRRQPPRASPSSQSSAILPGASGQIASASFVIARSTFGAAAS